MIDKGETSVFRVTWSNDATEDMKAENLILVARRHTDKKIAQLRGVNFILSCITGVAPNRYILKFLHAIIYLFRMSGSSNIFD